MGAVTTHVNVVISQSDFSRPDSKARFRNVGVGVVS